METWFNEAEAVEKIRSATKGKSFYWKYVRTSDEYRFIDATNPLCPRHDSVLKDGEKPESAAFLKIRTGDGIKVQVESWSMTLNIGPTEDDESRLTQLLVFHDPDCYGGANCECGGTCDSIETVN